MPELPEVETMRRGVLGCIGTTILGVEKPASRYRPLQMTPSWTTLRKKLIGRKVLDVRRLGKRVLLDLDDDHSLVFQPKMTGLLLVGTPPTPHHVRMVLSFDGERIPEITYWDSRGLGTIHYWSPAEVEEHLGGEMLGPDAIEVDWKTFKQRFEHHRREIKPALLDQKLLAGVGNLYASELLHRAHVHPCKLCTELNDQEWRRIHRSMLTILLAAIQAEGSTLSDSTYLTSLSEPGSYQNQHRVYDKENQTCSACCRGVVQRIVQGQRSTFFCEVCQPR